MGNPNLIQETTYCSLSIAKSAPEHRARSRGGTKTLKQREIAKGAWGLVQWQMTCLVAIKPKIQSTESTHIVKCSLNPLSLGSLAPEVFGPGNTTKSMKHKTSKQRQQKEREQSG